MSAHNYTTHTARADQQTDGEHRAGNEDIFPGRKPFVEDPEEDDAGQTKAHKRRTKGAKKGYFNTNKYACWMTGATSFTKY